MNNPHRDGRRLHPRFQVDETEGLLCYSTLANPSVKSAVKVTEIEKDSVTCKLLGNVSISSGTKVMLELNHSRPKKMLNGEAVSCLYQNGFTRVGVLFSKEDIVAFFPPSHGSPSPDQRKLSRRKETSKDVGKREFERRGLWPGLLSKSKRFFSRHAWELQNSNSYFYMKPFASPTAAHVIVDGREMIMLSSNNYLGLTTHPKVIEAATLALKKYGSGACASGILGGMLDIHLRLEEELARFEGTEAACLFSSGYVANVATLMTVLQKGDAVFNDELNHASLIDGSRLAGAEFRVYRHRDVRNLDSKLAKSKAAQKLVVADGVFSMDGDIAPLPDIFRVCKKHKAALMVDEAHATGVYGAHGRGLLEYFDMKGKADIVIGTMSKSLAASGGFIAGSKELVRILKHTARGAIFSANIPPVTCAIVLAALKLIDAEPERRYFLWQNADHLRSGLQELGYKRGDTRSPIIPVVFATEDKTNFATRELRKRGIFVCPVIFPAVKKDQTRLRLTVMASHTEEDIENVLAAFRSIKPIIDNS